MPKKKKIMEPIKGAGFYELFIGAVNKDKKLKNPSKKEFEEKTKNFFDKKKQKKDE